MDLICATQGWPQNFNLFHNLCEKPIKDLHLFQMEWMIFLSMTEMGRFFFVHPIHPELTWLTIATRQLALTFMLDSSDWLQMVSQGRLNEYFLFFSEKWFHQQFLLGKMSVVNSEIYVYLSCLSLKITWRFPIPIVYSIHVWYMHLHLR